MARAMLAHAKEWEKTEGWEALQERIDSNRTLKEFADGKGELNAIDGVFFPRIVDAESKASIIYLDEDRVKRDSLHLKQYIARQHIDSGDKTKWGNKPGRDLVVVWMKDGKMTNSEYLPRNYPGSPGWFADYWHATYKKAEKPDHVFGLWCAGLQVAAATCLSVGKYMHDPSGGFETGPIFFSALFGYGIAAWNSMYRNWVYRGSELSQTAKLWAVSYSFAYSVIVWKNGAVWVTHILDPNALLIHAHVFWNTAFHNMGRKAWYGVPKLMQSFRNQTGTKILSLFGKEYDTHIKATTWAQQKYYLIPYSLKLVGLVGMGLNITLPLIGHKVDLGTLLLLGSIPVAHASVVHFAERQNHPDAPKMREHWDKMKWLPITVPKSMFTFAARQGAKLISMMGKGCARLVTRSAHTTAPSDVASIDPDAD